MHTLQKEVLYRKTQEVRAKMKWFNECYGVYLFGIYLLLNVLDWLTGWYKARVKKEASSKAGLNGIIKKVGYWIILLIAFLIPYMFQRLGKDLLDMDLGYLRLLAGLHWRIF